MGSQGGVRVMRGGCLQRLAHSGRRRGSGFGGGSGFGVNGGRLSEGLAAAAASLVP